MSRTTLVLALTVGLALAASACGGGDGEGHGALTKTEFAEQADRICRESAARFDAELPDPVGGAKPVGLGAFMRGGIERLRTLEAPASIATNWYQGLALLEQATFKLDDAEHGDPTAQSEALWGLEASAHEHFDATDLPFEFCFVE